MFLIKTAIEVFLIKSYNKTNNMDEACRLAEKQFQGLSLIQNTNGDYYKIVILSSNNNIIDAISNIPIKK